MEFPILDFAAPWVALIQIGLYVLNPQLVGHFTDRLTSARIKIVLLGFLSLLSVVLTHLLDYAVTDTWSQFDVIEFVNIVVNFVFAWAVSQYAYDKGLKPSGASAAAQQSRVLQFIGPSPERVESEIKKAA